MVLKYNLVALLISSVLFEVNGKSASEQSVIDKGFIQLWIENIDDTTQRTNLTATALTQYKNTEIQCRTIVIGSASQVLSDYATLLVQSKAIINKLSVYC